VNKGASGALALIMLWLAFASFFVAFHPGGIRDPMFVTTDNPQGYARNPPDVIIWMIKRAISGSPADAASVAVIAV
jgi:hypothetical protein